MKRILFLLVVGLAVTFISACGGDYEEPAATPTAIVGGPQATMTLTSTAFAAGDPIPTKYACDGDNVSPPLEWDEPPTGTRSLALIMDDPDAPSGEFVHWVLYDLPATLRGLPEGVSIDEKPSQGGTNGTNGAGRSGYTGPCPPSGTHRYFFRLYAVDYELDASPGLTKNQLLQAMAGDILAQGELMGTYSRPQ